MSSAKSQVHNTSIFRAGRSRRMVRTSSLLAIIAMGAKSYGFSEQVARIEQGISFAGSHFRLNQLPELYISLERDETNFPVQYIGANVPQAWAAGSIPYMLASILGLQPDAFNRRLHLLPAGATCRRCGA